MEIRINYIDGIGIIGINGELDAHTSPELTLFFSKLMAEGTLNYVADLEGLTYSSSAGIRIFLGMARDARRNGGDMRIAAVQAQVDKIFKLSKFDRIVKIFPRVDEAVQSFKSESV
jgi:anti-sigma B factor antagonist